MKGNQIILGQYKGQEAAAFFKDGQLWDVMIDHDEPMPGTILRGRVDRPVKGQGGVFLASPIGSLFLRQVKGVRQGEELLVQVTGFAEDGKAIPVTQDVLFKSRYAIVTPNKPGRHISRSIKSEERRVELRGLLDEIEAPAEFGVILRSSCMDSADDAIAEDLIAMLDLAQAIIGDDETGPALLLDGDGAHEYAWREWSEPADVVEREDAFETHGVLEALDALCTSKVMLPNGASMYVEPTRALVAVDVNTGADNSIGSGVRTTIDALRELPRQLRLRGLGGQIVIDTAPVAKRDRQKVESVIRTAFRGDLAETALVGWTPLGHIELQRQRSRRPLVL